RSVRDARGRTSPPLGSGGRPHRHRVAIRVPVWHGGAAAVANRLQVAAVRRPSRPHLWHTFDRHARGTSCYGRRMPPGRNYLTDATPAQLARIEARLWPRIDTTGDCWMWTGKPNSERRPVINIAGVPRYVYRIVWEILVGPCPAALEPAHLCRARMCTNLDHIEWIPPNLNTDRGAFHAARKARMRD